MHIAFEKMLYFIKTITKCNNLMRHLIDVFRDFKHYTKILAKFTLSQS